MTASEQIIQVINDLCTKFGIAIDWTSENVIPYATALCEKLITWEIWSSVAWIGIMTILSIVSIIVTVRCKLFSGDFLDNFDVFGCFIICGLIILWVASVICIGIQLFDIIKCVTFPEMFVFEYIQNLITSAS